MLIDCDTCTARGLACDGCIVPVLLDAPPYEHEQRALQPRGGRERPALGTLDEDEQRALRVLADSGMIPSDPSVTLYEKSAGKAA